VRRRTDLRDGRAHGAAVPIFHFHVRDGDRLTLDPDGADLPGLGAARAKASEAIREAASRPLRPGQDLGRRRFEIADASGRVLATVAFRDVFGLH
jgi:hypothetical protein